jgi:hypothetical protein
MKIFNKRTTSHSEVVADLKERHTRLAGLRFDAQTALDTALAARQQHLIVGDLADGEEAAAVHADVSKAHSALVGIDDAIGVLQAQIASAELSQSSEERRVLAEANARALADVVDAVEKLLPGWLATAREMSALLGSLNNFRYRVAGLSQYLGDLGSEAEIGLKLILADLAGAVDAVARGEQQIKIGTASLKPADELVPADTPKDHFTYAAPSSGPSYRVPGAFAREKR